MPLNQIGGILELFQTDEILFDAPRANKAIENADATSFVVCTASPCATERLLADDCSSAFFVVVDITSRIAEAIGSGNQGLAIGGKAIGYKHLDSERKTKDLYSHAPSKTIDGSRIDQLEGLLVVIVLEDEDLRALGKTHAQPKAQTKHTVTTGPKISPTIVVDRGSLVRITVG
jgi:hypothetical protein